MASYRDFFAKQFTNPFVSEPFCPDESFDEEEIRRLALEIFDESAVLAALIRIPPHKAPGISGVSAVLLLQVADVVAPIMAKLFCAYFATGRIPSSWSRALVCPVPKIGDSAQLSNYRLISLTKVTRKVFELCLLEQLNASINLSPERGGFRKGRSTLDQIEALDTNIQHIRRDKKYKRAHLAFLDIKAVYVSVPRDEFFNCTGVGFVTSCSFVSLSLVSEYSCLLALDPSFLAFFWKLYHISMYKYGGSDAADTTVCYITLSNFLCKLESN